MMHSNRGAECLFSLRQASLLKQQFAQVILCLSTQRSKPHRRAIFGFGVRSPPQLLIEISKGQVGMRIAGLSPNRSLKIVNRFLISLLLGAQQAQIFQQYRIVRPLPESLKPFTLRARPLTSVPINRPEVRTGETATP